MANQIQVDEVRKATSPEDDADKAKKDADQQKITLALTRFKKAADHESENRKESLDDVRFSVGKQWPAEYLSERGVDGRPCLTMDQIQQSLNQVNNAQRQQRRGIQVNPVGSGATRKVAEVLQGMIRHVEVYSDAEIHYDLAFDQMTRGGFSWFRVRSEYPDEMTFDQEIRIECIQNQFTVYDDPGASGPLRENARFRFVIEDLSKAEYKKRYPNSELARGEEFSSIGDTSDAWHSENAYRVADYYHIEEQRYDIIRLADGSVKPLSDATEEELAQLQSTTAEDGSVTPATAKVRKTSKKQVVLTKMNAMETLEETILPGTMIPVVPLFGTDVQVDNKRYLAGLVRNAKDPQRMYNYQCSAATEMVALAPKAPFVGVKGQFKSGETQWKNMNTRTFPYLEYDPVAVGGKLAPPPQRNVAEPPIQATVILIRQAANDIKASLGMYDASLGAPGPEQSGKAILARQQQGNQVTFNFADNLDRTIRLIGRILLEWIPVIFDVPHLQRIVNPDKSVKMMGVYSSQNEGYSPDAALQAIQELDQGIQEVYDIGAGKFDVAISAGAAYQTLREEAVASMMELIKVYPMLMECAGDLLVGNMNWPFAQEIAKRLKTALPPQFHDPSDQSPEAQVSMLTAKLQQLGQQHELLTQALQEANEMVKSKRMELESKERIAYFQGQVALISADLKGNQAQAQATLEAMLGHIKSRMDQLHENIGIDQELQANKELATHEASVAPPEAPATPAA